MNDQESVCYCNKWMDIKKKRFPDKSLLLFCDMTNKTDNILVVKIDESGNSDVSIDGYTHWTTSTGICMPCELKNKKEFLNLQERLHKKYGMLTQKHCCDETKRIKPRTILDKLKKLLDPR